LNKNNEPTAATDIIEKNLNEILEAENNL